MSPGEKLAAWLIATFVAVTRWLALARSPWDSDEGLFMSALRHYDVVAHHPHPPGFPLFILTAKIFARLGFSDFHALQLISFVASIAIFPAMLFLGRELEIRPRVSIIAAAFLAFFPNVWFFGGTAFSDVPAMTLSIMTIALILRRSWVPAALLLGIAIGFRPQILLIAIVPVLISLLRRKGVEVTGSQGVKTLDSPDSLAPLDSLGRLFTALAITSMIVIASYGTAAHLSGGWARYRQSLAEHEEYIAQHDSFRAPLRPPMWELFDNFFLRPYDAPLINTIISALVALSGIVTLIRRRTPMLILLATFGPFCIAAWALLDRFSTSRFSIGYAPLIAFLAADGLDLLAGKWPKLESLAAAAIAAIMIVWTWPAISTVHRTLSPPFAATDWVAHRNVVAYVADEMRPVSDALLARMPHVDLPIGPPPLTGAMREGDVYVREGISSTPGTIVFRRERNRLASIARSTRYFEVSIVPVREAMRFADGWYAEEGVAPPPSAANGGTTWWRWMSGRGRIVLPPHLARMRIALQMYVPLDALAAAPNIAISFNGRVLDRIRATEKDIERSYDVNARINAPNELVIETDRTINPAARGLQNDTRDLGLRVNDIEWSSR
jgi:hypothetical protein